MARSKRLQLGLGLMAFVVLLDQLSKAWILYGLNLRESEGNCRLDPNCHIELSSIMDLTFVWNSGVSFGLFQADTMLGRMLLSGFALIVIILMSVWLFRSDNKILSAALGLIIGGAAGNLIDRLVYGKVVDFINFSDIKFVYVFNIADAAINVGIFLILLDAFVLEPRRKPV